LKSSTTNYLTIGFPLIVASGLEVKNVEIAFSPFSPSSVISPANRKLYCYLVSLTFCFKVSNLFFYASCFGYLENNISLTLFNSSN